MDRITGMQVFMRVVETKSFSKAAAALGLVQSTATKAVAQAERQLGVRLLHRSTRGVTPTELGHLYYDRCKRVIYHYAEAEQLVLQDLDQAVGTLRINTSVGFGRRVMAPLVLRFMQAHPSLQIDLTLDDRYVNLVEQGIDVAIRMGRLADSALGARYLGVNPWVLVAALKYLRVHGKPKVPQDLSRHACLVYSSVQGDARWLFNGINGVDQSVPVQGPLRTNNLSTVLSACEAGLGLAVLPKYVARDALKARRVVPLLEQHTLPSQEIHAVFSSPKLVPQKVGLFTRWLQVQLDGDWWDRVVPDVPE